MQAQHRAHLWLLLEITVIAVWAAYIARPYLNFDPAIVPGGLEYGSSMQSHFLWEHVQSCVTCAFWNGDIRGGAPAFADIHGDMLHPAVTLPSLLFGAINGTKVALAIVFFMSGLAQWWLGLVIGLSRLVRVWTGLIGVAAGHIVGRIEWGHTGLATSTAACVLVIPALIALYRSPTRSSTTVFGLTIAGAALAGQGYFQIGILLLLPLSFLYLLESHVNRRHLVARLMQGITLGALLAAPFLVPFAHLWPSFAKEQNYSFEGVQDLSYIPLTLVVGEYTDYAAATLNPFPQPFLYVNYVGWIVVVLAVFGIATFRKTASRFDPFFFSFWIIGAFLIASGAPFNWLVALFGETGIVGETLTGIRYPSLIAGLAVPIIIALAGVGLQALLRHEWAATTLQIGISRKDALGRPRIRVPSRLFLILLALLALNSVRSFSQEWIQVTRADLTSMDAVFDRLTTSDLQWVQTPFGEHWWLPFTADRGLKIADAWRPWRIDGYELPKPSIAASRSPEMADMEAQPPAVDGVQIFKGEDSHAYASVVHPDGSITPCFATGEGGHIDVRCESNQPGQLVVLENNLGSWDARVNGNDTTVAKNGQWVAVDVPAGDSTIELRYRPWDVWLGLVLMVVGVVWATVWLVAPDRRWLPPNISTPFNQRLDVFWQRLRSNSQEEGVNADAPT